MRNKTKTTTTPVATSEIMMFKTFCLLTKLLICHTLTHTHTLIHKICRAFSVSHCWNTRKEATHQKKHKNKYIQKYTNNTRIILICKTFSLQYLSICLFTHFECPFVIHIVYNSGGNALITHTHTNNTTNLILLYTITTDNNNNSNSNDTHHHQ